MSSCLNRPSAKVADQPSGTAAKTSAMACSGGAAAIQSCFFGKPLSRLSVVTSTNSTYWPMSRTMRGNRPVYQWSYSGGRSSLLSQPNTLSVFRGSGCSQSKHWNVRGPLPPGGSARIRCAHSEGKLVVRPGPCDKFPLVRKLVKFQKGTNPRNPQHNSAVVLSLPLTERLNLETFSTPFNLGHCTIQIRTIAFKYGHHPHCNRNRPRN